MKRRNEAGIGWLVVLFNTALLPSTAGEETHVAGGVWKPDQDEAGNVTAGRGRPSPTTIAVGGRA